MDIAPIDPAFERVWRRVKGEQPPPPAQGDSLADALAGEVQRRQTYLNLNFLREAADCLARCRTLRALGFVLGGVWPSLPHPPAERYPSRAAAARALWQRETDCAALYRQWAEAAETPASRTAFSTCVERCRQTADRLWRRLENT